jgi:hypothetical protein
MTIDPTWPRVRQTFAKAQQWAEFAEDAEVEPGMYSAKHHAAKAEASASAASSSAGSALASAASAQDSVDSIITDMILSERYRFIQPVWNAQGVLVSASVKWVDGSEGDFTSTQVNAEFLAVDAYTVTHDDSGLTLTQPAITRDALGQPTSIPTATIE